MVFLVIILFIIAIICYHYAKYRPKQKTDCYTNNIQMENNGLNKVNINNHTWYYFDKIIKFEDFHSDNILLNGKSYENI